MTTEELATAVEALARELARRIDALESSGELGVNGVVSLGSIGESLASLSEEVLKPLPVTDALPMRVPQVGDRVIYHSRQGSEEPARVVGVYSPETGYATLRTDAGKYRYSVGPLNSPARSPQYRRAFAWYYYPEAGK